MIRKQISYIKVQTNQIVWTICTILFLSFPHNCDAQDHLDSSMFFKTEKDWSNAIDRLFQKGIINQTMDAWVLLRVKVDGNGKVISAHIVISENIDTSLFYSICATIEDCYDTPFFKKEYEMHQDHLVNGFLYENIMRKFSKSDGPGQESCTEPNRKN